VMKLRYEEYVPSPASDPVLEFDPAAWAAQHGFGISTFVGTPGTVAASDPNLAYMDSLPAALREDYRRALFGDEGCLYEASETVRAIREPIVARAQDLISGLHAAIGANPVVQESEIEWRDCAARAGRPMSRQNLRAVVEPLFRAKLQEIVEPTSPTGYDEDALADLWAAPALRGEQMR